jgi:hypothetical protein
MRYWGNGFNFFVDGQKTLQAAILQAFSWCINASIILDWYHLEEKCRLRDADKGLAAWAG